MSSLWLSIPLVIQLAIPTKGNAGQWNYDDRHRNELCFRGKRQSPIDLDIGKAIVMRWAPISFHHYDAHGFVTVVKDGQKGGGLRGKYYLQQFHFHWSGNDLTGSEHTIGRLHYPMEGYNASTAQHAPETIAVVAVLLQVAKRGQAFMDLKEAFVSTNITGSKRESVEYTLKPLLPKDTATFFRYEGSLTTPPCTEGVIWTVLVEPNYVSAQQNYLSHEGRCLQQNWREIQPLNGRPIYLNKLKSISERMSISSPQINNKSNLSGNFLDGIMFDFPEE
ncbi:carbonate dehydratase, eukaryotic-type [Ancylostoma ceylanicum]|uniref:carbonic anhydrase n=1 Tax=Ancylostoma ceylanicum TaxID=53326 RepID=A0A0D6LZR8_9BILA|nr:carbonate dehydratase, eukaryotic-type [Ancylostoma ceylanicum]